MSIDYGNVFDRMVRGTYEEREADWRNGAVVYQVLVDRFAPSENLEAKRSLYAAPKQLHSWDELPQHGVYLEDEKLWSHEIDFWGGDLASTRTHLEYIAQLGADVLYLNPIHLSYTNHGYDSLDYAAVKPEYGTRADVVALAEDLHARGMRLVLDGVFNHMGRNAAIFREAEADSASPYRDWFHFDASIPGGARAWWRAENLPELELENPAVREHIYGGHDSIVRKYLRDGIDGWRLDVAFDIGMRFLDELTKAAHDEKPGSLVIGEIANYPKEWFPAVDGLLTFMTRDILLRLVNGTIPPAHAQRILARMYAEPGYEHLLKSWLYLDNHDTPRLATLVPDANARDIALVLQCTLPGSPNLYYGTELGMTGGDDPEMRAPMRWDLVTDDNLALRTTKQLLAMRAQHRALRIGDFRVATTDRLFGFERYTDKVEDAVIVLVNPTHEEISETVLVGDSKLMDNHRLIDLWKGHDQWSTRGLIHANVPAQSALVLVPEIAPVGGYTAYKRVQ